MTLYVIHNTDGRILKHGSALEQDVDLVLVGDGETLAIVDRLPNAANDSIVDGRLVNLALPPLARDGYELLELALTSLAKSDWTQLPDVTMTDARRAEWQVYRQELRNILNNRDPGVSESANEFWPQRPG